jgi:methylenetetrahydrofolate dehydrogenase (NADP+)/methenyltetrahydrofolate cyclohydrolase
MPAQLLDGKKLARQVREAVQTRIDDRLKAGRRRPGLAVVLVGGDTASGIYVNKKIEACAAAGLHSEPVYLDAAVSQEQLLATIDRFNQDDAIDGILVQLPLPKQLDASAVIDRIDPLKDVDGFHPYNVGRLAQRAPLIRSCTPLGIIRLLEAAGETFRGRRAVIVGASNIVGRPMALELLLKGCTVTVCHRFTEDLESQVRQAELLVVAVGKPDLVPGEWVRPGATVVDVGMNRGEDGRLQGDVSYEAACERASWITPVPGGVGPMTVAMLLENTLLACELRETPAA